MRIPPIRCARIWRFSTIADRSVFVLRQFQELPRPLTSAQARDLLAELRPPYDLMARWQLYTGLRISELLRLMVNDISQPEAAPRYTRMAYRVIDVTRKARKPGYVIASASLLEETSAYLAQYHTAWLRRATRRRRAPARALFLNRRGAPVKKNTYQTAVRRAGEACGFKAFPHLLRATFGCWLLARLERLARQGAEINPNSVRESRSGSPGGGLYTTRSRYLAIHSANGTARI